MKLASRLNAHQLFVLPLGLVLVDIAYQNGASDPLNPVKLWALGLIAVWCISDLATSPQILNQLKQTKVTLIFLVILGVLVSAFLFAFLLTSEKSIGLLGDTGRNIGFLNYVFLVSISLYSSFKITKLNIRNIYWTALALSFALSIYGFFQHFKIDFLKWNTQYNPIILTTGNPDFAASLLGLLAVISFTGLFLDFSKIVKLSITFVTGFTILIIYWTQARQGLVGTLAGIGFILLILVWQRSTKAAIVLFICEIIVGLFSILGMLQIGPLTKYFFKASITDRGYNWRAAISMFKSHPLFGIGVDRYAAYFLQYRSPKYPLIFGYTQTVTNAHNVFLEIFATAGIFAGIAYLAFIAFIGFRAFIAIKKSQGREQILVTGIVAGWIVFVAQSLISVDSVVISIWGWVLGGAIVGLSLISDSKEQIIPGGRVPKFARSTPKRAKGEASSFRGIVFSLLFIALCLIVVPMYRNETATARFAQIQAPTDPGGKDIYRSIAQKTFDQPFLNPNYKESIALTLAKNGYGPEAISYFKKTIASDPRNTNSYSTLSIIYENLKSPQEAIPYRKQLALLDPYGAENLVSLENDYLLTGDKSSAIAIRDSILAMAPGTDVAKRAAALIAK